MAKRLGWMVGAGLTLAAVLALAGAARTTGATVAGTTLGTVTGTGQANLRVSRGEYLVRSGGCADCHTPKVMDKKLGVPVDDETHRFAGHPANAPEPGGTLGPADMALVGPTFTSFKMQFGTVYAANLTPDAKTGIGSWTEDLFIKTMRTGKHLGVGRAVLPPMPWPGVGAMTDDDLRSIFAYFKSLPAVSNQVPVPKVPEPVLAGMAKANEAMAAQIAQGAQQGTQGAQPPQR